MDGMLISQLAERTGVPATTLRFYERAGLLPASRTTGGYRVFDAAALDRLAFIGAGKRLGLPLAEIGALLDVRASSACRDVRADLRPRITARVDETTHRIAELTAFTTTLHTALDHLDALPDSSAPCTPACVTAPDPHPEDGPRSQADDRPGPWPDPAAWRTAPVACTLAGDDRAERASDWRAALDGAVRTPVPDGIRLTLPAARAAAVAELAAAEQDCCPFFDIRVHFAGHELHLDVRAPEAAADLLAEVFGPYA
jgi:DNA-binding transcriptional MerR regulator